MTIDQQGAVYVADWRNDRVQKFSPDGEPLVCFGSQFDGVDDGGMLRRPADVAVDSDGDVYVVDWANNRVQIYYPDGDIICGLYGRRARFLQGLPEGHGCQRRLHARLQPRDTG